MKKILYILALCITSLCTPSFLLASAQEKPTIKVADYFTDLQTLLASATDTDAIGWDCDNTWVTKTWTRYPHLYDFEFLRELQNHWTRAGAHALSEGVFQGATKDFARACWVLSKDYADTYGLVDAQLIDLHSELTQRQVDTFVCTGLPPEDRKVDFLKKTGFDPSLGYAKTDNVAKLFVKKQFCPFGEDTSLPGWLYAREKASALTSYLHARNEDRSAQSKAPLTRLFYVDNHLETLQGIRNKFHMEGVELVLIHWRQHALSLEAKDHAGELIPAIVAEYEARSKELKQLCAHSCEEDNDSCDSSPGRWPSPVSSRMDPSVGDHVHLGIGNSEESYVSDGDGHSTVVSPPHGDPSLESPF